MSATKQTTIKCSFILLMSFIFLNTIGYSQKEEVYDEIAVILNVDRVGTIEIPIVIDKQIAYLPVKEVFDFLKIKNTLSLQLEQIEGFFINPQAIFIIDKYKNQIIYQDKVYVLKPNDIIKTETGIYLKIDYFGKVFGLDCSFNFRNLSVTMNSKIELPTIKEMQQEILRQNISKLQGEKKVDTVIKRTFPKFQVGMADWALFSSQSQGYPTNVRLNLALGAVVLGGEANAYLNINSTLPIKAEEQFYRWRIVNNDFTPLRQITLGTIFTPTIATTYAPITGIQVTNSPSNFRRSFGTYTISDKTEPGWTVELYMNNVLVNYTKADASGFFTFDVPLVYGNSEVKLKHYGPWGEVRTSEKQILIPFNFLPTNQYEYTFTSGVIQDDDKTKITRATINYGLTRRVTIGAGVEIISTINGGKPMTFFNTSIRLGSNFLFSGEHVSGIISRGIFTYNLPSNIRFEANYAKYEKNQNAIRSGKNTTANFLEERKFIAIVPIRTKLFTSFTRLTLNQLVLPSTTFNTAELMISSIISNLSVNLATNLSYTDPSQKIFTSNLSVTTRLPKGIRFTPLIQYDYSQNNFLRVRTEFEKNITTKGFLNFTFERDLIKKENFFSLGFRYNFSFAQFSFFGRKTRDNVTLTEAVNGSLLYNQDSKKFITSNQNNVGRGGFIIQPFLDINANGKKDMGEPKVNSLGIKVNAGITVFNAKDSNYNVVGLEAYNIYFIDIEKDAFDNIAWKVKNPSIKVIVEPNHLKVIEVPILVMGEVSGRVNLQNNQGNKGVGRIIVNIFNSNGEFVNRVLTEADGYFSYLGLTPGSYYIESDEKQLLKLKIKSTTSKIKFQIRPTNDGEIIDNINIQLIGSNTTILE